MIPGGVRYSDLPKNVRDQVDAGLGRKPRRRPGRGDVGGPTPYRCHACGEVFPSWSRSERHAREQGHVRQEFILGDASPD